MIINMVDKNSNLVNILNLLFDYYCVEKINNLRSLAYPKCLDAILLEIDDSIQEQTELKFAADEENSDDFNSRYSGVLNSLLIIDKYIELNRQKENISSKFNVNNIKIKDLLSDSNSDLLTLSQYLIALTAVSPRKDIFLERMGDCSDDLIGIYLEIVETYLNQEDESNVSRVEGIRNEINRRKSIACSRMSIMLNMSLVDDKTSFYGTNNHVFDNQKAELITLNKKLTDELKVSYNKIKELSHNIEVMKRKEDEFLEKEEIINKDINSLSVLKAVITERDVTINELKRKLAEETKKHDDDVNELNSKIEKLSSKEHENRTTIKESEKLKTKLKELNVYKQKAEEFDNIVGTIDSLKSELESTKKDKGIMQHKIEVLKADLLNAQNKIKSLEVEKKSIEINFENAKNEFALENKRMTLEFNRFSGKDEFNRQSTFRKKLIEAENNRRKTGLVGNTYESGRNSTINEEDDDWIITMERENVQLKAEVDELLDKQTKLQTDLNLKSECESMINSLNEQINGLHDELKLLKIEKTNWLESQSEYIIQISKLENEKKKGTADLSEKSKLYNILISEKCEIEATLKSTSQRIKYLESMVESLEQERTTLKASIMDNSILINKLTEEKKKMQALESKSIQKLMQDSVEKEIGFTKRIKELESELREKDDLINLRDASKKNNASTGNDLKELLDNITIKNKKIKELESQLTKKEEQFNVSLSVYKERETLYKEELKKRKAEINSFDESIACIRKKHKIENDTVLNSLYEMALQYNGLKMEHEKLTHSK